MAFRHEVLHVRRQKQRLIDIPGPKILAHSQRLNQTRLELNSDYSDRLLVLTMLDLWVAYCPCFETLASLAPQHEVVVFQRVRPHPEEVTKWPSRRMGRNTDLRFQVLGFHALSEKYNLANSTFSHLERSHRQSGS